MRVLLDECLPVDFRQSFAGMSRVHVSGPGFKGKKNGDLLQATENAGYDVFLTADQGLRHHAHGGTRTLAVIVLSTPTDQLDDLRLLVDSMLYAMANIAPGPIVTIQPPRS